MEQRIAVFNWTIQKQGSAESENDDACRVEWVPDSTGSETLLVAVSDGASEAMYAGKWARALVEKASTDWTLLSAQELDSRLQYIRDAFQPFPPERVSELPWYVREKYQTQGSQATMLVVAIAPGAEDNARPIHAVAVGDTCLVLFHIAETGLIHKAFPLQRAADFGTTPFLIRNRLPNRVQYQKFEGLAQPGDLLLACTDAVAKWVMECLELNWASAVFDVLLELTGGGEETAETPSIWERMFGWRDTIKTADERGSSPNFANVISRYQRPEAKPRMRNDDATCVLCVVPSNSSTNAVSILRQFREATLHFESRLGDAVL